MRGRHAPQPLTQLNIFHQWLIGKSPLGLEQVAAYKQHLVAGGYASEHDALIAGKLAHVLCGGTGGAAREVTEDEMLELEREAFVSLCGEPKTQQRMQHMLMKNKPLRN